MDGKAAGEVVCGAKVDGRAAGEVVCGAKVGVIARLLRAWVKLDEAGGGLVDVGEVAEDNGIGVA